MGGKTLLDLHPRGSLLGIVPITFLFLFLLHLHNVPIMLPLCSFNILHNLQTCCQLECVSILFPTSVNYVMTFSWYELLNCDHLFHCVLMCFLVASPLHFWLPHQCHIMLSQVSILECTPTNLHPHTCKLAPSIFNLIYT
jgi:hypothetical protein